MPHARSILPRGTLLGSCLVRRYILIRFTPIYMKRKPAGPADAVPSLGTTPPRGSKLRQAPAAHTLPRGRTAWLRARFRGAAEEPNVVVRLILGPESSFAEKSSLMSDEYIAATCIFDRLQHPEPSRDEGDLQLLTSQTIKQSKNFTIPHFPLPYHSPQK